MSTLLFRFPTESSGTICCPRAVLPKMGKPPSWITHQAPNPEDAGRRWERIVTASETASISLPDTEAARSIARLACQRAPYLATLLARDPTRLARVAKDPYLSREKPRDVLESQVQPVTGTPDDLLRFLRVFRADELVRTGVRELEYGTPEEVGRELARLADLCFQMSIDYHLTILNREHGTPHWRDADGSLKQNKFCVIAMGKHGGEELNFSSDVDVIYVYRSDADEEADPGAHQFYSKLAERVSYSMGEMTDEDVVFRVDLRLRPEGTRGAITNSLPSLERYYESWGRPWERQAWLKARPCAGSMELGAEVMATLEPFIYPRALSPSIVQDVQSLNRKIKSEIVHRDSIETGFDLKNGEGGIREIEFFVQAHQLIHAGQTPSLRTRSTLVTLDQLLFSGIIAENERHELAEAYRFLRHTEHVLQLESGRQTQRLPSEPEAFDLLAQRTGNTPIQFRDELEHHTNTVAALFATLDDDEPPLPSEVLFILDGDLDAEEEISAFANLGFNDPIWAHGQFKAAKALAGSPLSGAGSRGANRVAPQLLAEIAASPDPDQGLYYLLELISRRKSWAAVWRLMAEKPAVLRLVSSLFGTSNYLSKQFLDNPELIDNLVHAGRLPSQIPSNELAESFARRLSYFGPEEAEAWWESLAEAKNAEVLRIGLADIANEMSPKEVSVELSHVAEVCLQQAFAKVKETLTEKYGVARDENGEEVKMAVLAQGKLGSKELGYASDLDVIFVYSADGSVDGPRPMENITLMTRMAQRLMGALHTLHRTGRLYEVDTRLRPSGSQGLLVSSMSAWTKYHQGAAKLWERMALTRLRPVAGEMKLGEKVASTAQNYIFGEKPGTHGHPDRAEIASGVHAMRERIETELGGSVHGLDVKVGRGGLIDIEFAAQYIALAYGHQHPEVRSTSTTGILTAASSLGLVRAEDAAVLGEAYDFMRLLEHRMRVVHDRPVHKLPDSPAELDKLARRARFPDGAALQRAFKNWTGAVRSAYRGILEL